MFLIKNRVKDNLYCPACYSNALNPTKSNTPLIDFVCPRCEAIYQLKAKSKPFGMNIADGAYEVKIDLLKKGISPHWLLWNIVRIPFLIKINNGKVSNLIPILLHSLLFGVWHMGVFWLATWYVGIMVCLVPTLAGFIWGWQAQHDKTILYTVIVHIILVVILSMFYS